MSLRLERSVEEAYLYMELRPCGVCGERECDYRSAVVVAEGDLASQYQGTCPGCGTEREFVFRLPPEVSLPGPELQFGGPEPSELLDAGEWLWVAGNFAAVGSLDDPAALTGEKLAEVRADLTAAAAAVDEVLKFLPADAAEPPDGAFWSELGRRVRQRDRAAFHRDRLVADRDRYRAALAALPAG